MPKSSKQRMAAHRARQSAAGVVGVTIVLPKSDVLLFRQWAGERRKEYTSARRLTKMHLKERRNASRTDDAGGEPVVPAAHEIYVDTPEDQPSVVAEKIIREVARLGWPLGMHLGSETQLMEAHECSRSVLRQAARLLEYRSVVTLRKGRPGGLFVAQPSLSAAAGAVRVYLQNQRIHTTQLNQLRVLLETESVSRTIQRLTRAGIERLQGDLVLESAFNPNTLAASLQRLHFTIAELSGDPALLLLTHVALSLSDPLSTFARLSPKLREKIVRRLRKYHTAVVDAIILRNVISACSLMKQYLEGHPTR